MDPGAVLAAVVAVLGIAGAVGGAVGVGLRSQLSATREQLEELRTAVTFEQSQREIERTRCDQQIGELRGQLEVLRSDVMTRLLRELKPAIVEAIDRGMARHEQRG